MERVAFLVEPDDQRISCMLNPETVIITRSAGIKERASIGGHVSGENRSDMPLLYAGGGVTHIEMELLFDVTISGSSLRSNNVRDFTAPFFHMAENIQGNDRHNHPKTVRMVWGKSWNIPGVITDIAERLDYFTKSGIPRRSWLKLRLRRVNEEFAVSDSMQKQIELSNESSELIDALDPSPPYVQNEEKEALAAKSVTVKHNDRLDSISNTFYNDPSLWRILASFNGITDITEDSGNMLITIPPIDELKKLL